MLTIVILASAFAAGATATAIWFLRAGIASEESGKSLFGDAPTPAAARTRRIVALGVSDGLRTARPSRATRPLTTDQRQPQPPSRQADCAAYRQPARSWH